MGDEIRESHREGILTMNPLRIADQLRSDYLELLSTTFSPRQERLRRDFRAAIEREGFLTREPFVSLAQPYKIGSALTELHAETRRRFGPIAETPYAHQASAARRILNGEPAVVATGTGSGKTEAFLMPILDHCIRSSQTDVVKAILVYPMNALANDQRDRIRKLVAGTKVSFGVYTGETKQFGTRPDGTPDNERLTRGEFRAHPPDLLLTNYRMLEYLLLRGDGRALFKNHAVRFIVLDEVHTYKGALGTDVACLLRRMRAALGGTNPLFIGTSATLQTGEGDPRAGVAEFFARLTGQPTSPESVIREETHNPDMFESSAESFHHSAGFGKVRTASTGSEADRFQRRHHRGVVGAEFPCIPASGLAKRAEADLGYRQRTCRDFGAPGRLP
jgi:ATP-dependent helicase YprA (DUF1998 family)